MESKTKSFKRKIQESPKFTQKPIQHEQSTQLQIDHQQSINFLEGDYLPHQKTELTIFSNQKGFNKRFCLKNSLNFSIEEISETNIDDEDLRQKNDVSLMSYNTNFLGNQGSSKPEIVQSKAQNVFGLINDQSIEQCDCRCQISDYLCQGCNCWPYCANLRLKNSQEMTSWVSEENSYACFSEEKANADFEQVTKQDISMEEEDSLSMILSSMGDESDQRTPHELSSNQPQYNLEEEIDSFFQQSSSSHGHSHSSKGSCRCKNKNCADGRCACRRRGGMCGPECGCIHQACKNQEKAPQTQFVPRRESLIQAIIDQSQLKLQLEDMSFEGFQYSY